MRPSSEDATTSPAPGRSPARLPFFLAPPFLRTVGLTALVALAVEILLLPRLVVLDGAFWRGVLFARGCGTDAAVDRIVTVTTWVALALLAIAALGSLKRDGVRAAWPPLAICAVGLFVGKVMKNFFMRERPSMLPEVAIGHSFPSGHVMNTTLAALAMIVLAAGSRHVTRWWTAGAVLVGVVTTGRLLLGHHWLLDAIGGGLAALALAGLCLPAFRRRPLLAPAVLALVLTLVLAVDLHWRALEIRLASPLTARASVIADVDVAAALGTSVLSGDWEATAERTRSHAVAWLRGAGTIKVELGAGPVAGRAFGVSTLPAGSQAELALAGRPNIDDGRCVSLHVTVNDLGLRPFVTFAGWREYRLLLPPGTLGTGVNEVRIDVTDTRGRPRRFALAYLRIDSD